MPGLILKLRPHEELMINGVVVENGGRKAWLRVKTEGAHILRLRDALCAEEADTPLARAYYIAQRAVAGQLSNRAAAAQLHRALDGLGERAQDVRDMIADPVAEGDFYRAMRTLGALMAQESAAPGETNAPANV